MAIRCNDCYTRLERAGRVEGLPHLKCPDCGKLWLQSRSMTGPEWHFYPVDEKGELRSYTDSPIDTLDQTCIFYTALLLAVFAAAAASWWGS